MKYNFTLKSLLAFLVLLLANSNVNAQCGLNPVNAGSITPNVFFQTVTVVDNEYRTFQATAGCTYTFSFCQGGGSYSLDNQLQIFDAGNSSLVYSDDVCGVGAEIGNWSCPTSGTYKIQMTRYYCQNIGSTAVLAYSSSCPPPVPCTGQPLAGTATATTTAFNCSGFPALNLLGGTTPGLNLSFTWESSPNGLAPWTPVPGATNLSIPNITLSTPITATTHYRCVTTCSASGQSNTSSPVQITVTPASAPVVTTPITINCGDVATLNATAVPGGYINWFPTAVGGTPFATGLNVNVTPTTNTTYYAEKFFPVTAVNTTGGVVVDHNGTTGDDRSGIAVSPNYAYVVGDNNTGRYNKMDLTGGTSLPRRDGLFSDVITQRLWSFSNGTTPHDNNTGGTINAIVELDEDLNVIGSPITLSQTFNFGSLYGGQNLIAPGYGFVIFWTGGTFYRIDLTTGAVTNLGAAGITIPYVETWASWGWSEFDGTNYYVYHLTNNTTIVKRNLTNGTQTTVQTFSNMGDMGCMAYNTATNRLYFHYEGSGQFGGTSETLGYVGVTSDNNCGAGVRTPVVVNVIPPGVTIATTPTTICVGESTTTTFTGTPNSTVTYTVNGGANQTIVLNGAGTNSITESPTVNTTYNLVSVVSGACSGAMTGSSSVTVNPVASGQFFSNTLTVCKDQPASIAFSSTATSFPIDIEYTDGTNTYNYIASTGSEFISVPSDVAGSFTYTITNITNQYGCDGTPGVGSGLVTVNDRPTATFSSVAPGVCPGGSTDVTLTFTGTGPFIYEYTDGSTPVAGVELTNSLTFTVSPTADVTYSTVTLLDQTACAVTPADIASTITIQAYDTTIIIAHPVSTSSCTQNSATFTMTAGGDGLSYVWYENGVPVVAGPNYTINNNTLLINDVSGLGGNQYYVVVSGLCGVDKTSNSATLTEDFGNTWSGTTSTDWDVPTNWSCGTVPIITTNVLIPTSTLSGNMPLVNIPTALCNDVTLAGAGASLGFAAGTNQLAIYGNLTNSGGTFNGTGGTIEMAGTNQSINGALTFDDLDINGGGTKTLNGDVTVEGILNLMNGMLALGNSNLTITDMTAQTTGSATSYIVTDGTGEVVGQNMGITPTMFHVGIPTSYNPVTIENEGDADTFMVRVMPNVYVDGDGTNPAEVTNPVVDRTWMISEQTPGGSFATVTPHWNGVSEEVNGFDQSHVYVAHYMGGMWTSELDSAIYAPAAVAAGSMWTAMEDSITSFSPFAVASYGSFPLAIRLTSITAANVGTRNKVEWKSATEATGDIFELERSADAKTFTKIATVAANGKPSTYLQWDESPVQGVNYYRVKLVDANGKYSYSKVVSATVGGTNTFAIEAYPNPVHNTVSVKVNGMVSGKGSVVVTDVTGKVVSAVTTVENNSAELNVSHLANGMYLLNYTDDVRNESIKINKQ